MLLFSTSRLLLLFSTIVRVRGQTDPNGQCTVPEGVGPENYVYVNENFIERFSQCPVWTGNDQRVQIEGNFSESQFNKLFDKVKKITGLVALGITYNTQLTTLNFPQLAEFETGLEILYCPNVESVLVPQLITEGAEIRRIWLEGLNSLSKSSFETLKEKFGMNQQLDEECSFNGQLPVTSLSQLNNCPRNTHLYFAKDIAGTVPITISAVLCDLIIVDTRLTDLSFLQLSKREPKSLWTCTITGNKFCRFNLTHVERMLGDHFDECTIRDNEDGHCEPLSTSTDILYMTSTTPIPTTINTSPSLKHRDETSTHDQRWSTTSVPETPFTPNGTNSQTGTDEKAAHDQKSEPPTGIRLWHIGVAVGGLLGAAITIALVIIIIKKFKKGGEGKPEKPVKKQHDLVPPTAITIEKTALRQDLAPPANDTTPLEAADTTATANTSDLDTTGTGEDSSTITDSTADGFNSKVNFTVRALEHH